MAGIPQNFQALSNVLANYDFVDIASGTGYITFYGGNTVDLRLLSNKIFYAQDVSTNSSTLVNGASTKRMDLDFDVLLNRPIDLKGTAIVELPFYVTSSGNTAFWYFTLRVRKWDGVTETEIATNDSASYSQGGTNAYYMTAIDITIPLTHFKIGETIRLTVECWGYTTGGGVTATVKCGHDPRGRTTGWDTSGAVPSTLLFQCPVRLNL